MIIDTSTHPHWVNLEATPVASVMRRPWLAVACWTYLLAVIAVWMVLREAGDRWWPATALMLAPRWPVAVPLLVLLPCVLRARRWWLVGTTVAATIVVLMPIMGLRVSLTRAESPKGEMRLMTCNIHRQHVDVYSLSEFISALRPDVVALQGWSEAGHAGLFADDAMGPWNLHREGELLLASRFPIVGVTPLAFPDERGSPPGESGAAAVCTIRTGQGVVNLINLHLASPHAGLVSMCNDYGDKLAANIERRRSESMDVRGAAESLHGPVLLAGDFNTTDDSPIFRENWAGYADAFGEQGLGFGYTYRIGRTQLRIDHVLAGPSCRVIRCWVGPEIGSPHRPLVVDVNCR